LSGNPKFKDIRWIDESELLGTSGLQAVLVESSVPELQPLAARCIKAGLHVHLEKPGGTDHAEFTGLLAAAKQHRVHVQLGYMLRYNPAFEFCLEAVRQGWLGPITESVGIMSKDADEQGRRELLSYPGGAMFELGCHLIDALIAMLGAPQRVSPFDRRSSAKQDALIDNQLAVIEYPSATATIRCSLVDPANNKRRQFYLGGEQGAIEIYPLEPPHLKLTLKRSVGGYDAGEHQVELPKVDGRYTAQLADFAAVVRGERPPRYSAEHDLAVHKALLAASNLKVT
jgi:predicted dehydrogenase